MFRLTLVATAALAGLTLGACSGTSDSMRSNGTYAGGEGIRFDQNGNKTYDPNVGDHSRRDHADADRGGYAGNRYDNGSASADAERRHRNAQDVNDRTWHNDQSQRSDTNRSSWADRPWNDRDMVMVNESELPTAARAGLSREANGAALTETGRAMWDGKQTYCAKVVKNGHPYRIITDADGKLLTSRRLD